MHSKPYVILAHELFDALPVYSFVYDKDKGWLEKVIKLSKNKKLEVG